MAKRFKLKISRVLPSFQSCRSKDPSTLPVNPVPSFLRLSPVNPKLITLDFPSSQRTKAPPLPRFKSHRSSLKRHVSSAFNSIGCGIRSRSSTQYLSETDLSESPPPPTPLFHWEKEDKWHVIAKAHDETQTPRQKVYTSDDDDVLPPPPPPNTEKKKRRPKKYKTGSKIRISTSSADSELFSSESFDDDVNVDDEEETETLVSSSRSFSPDSSSELNPHLETIREGPPFMIKRKKKKNNNKKVKAPKRCVLKERSRRSVSRGSSSPESESPARLSLFLQRLIPCTVEGKVRESFAVVKKSEDPLEDFRRSMMEMILEKQMFEEKDLEQLLHCFLSLNSRQHHGVIVKAFSEIWDALFCISSSRRSSSSSSVHHRISQAL